MELHARTSLSAVVRLATARAVMLGQVMNSGAAIWLLPVIAEDGTVPIDCYVKCTEELQYSSKARRAILTKRPTSF